MRRSCRYRYRLVRNSPRADLFTIRNRQMQTSKVLSLPMRQVSQDRGTVAGPNVATFLRIQAAVVSRERFVESATAFAAELATEFGLERASVGLVDGDSVNVVALSH